MRSIGQRGELLVAERLIAHGWGVAHPLSDTARFDLLTVKGDRMLRVQVKSTQKQHSYKDSRPHYQFQLAHGLSSKKRYDPHDVDFFICCALDTQKFWVIPYGAIRSLTLKIYNGKTGKIHAYREAWHLLECDKE